MTESDDGFQVVRKKKARRSGATQVASYACKHNIPRDEICNDVIDINKCRAQIEDYLVVLESSPFYKSFCDLFLHVSVCDGESCERDEKSNVDVNDDIVKVVNFQETKYRTMVVYGIGSIGTNVIARIQFSFVLLLTRKYKFRSFVYDPVLTESEKTLITEYGMECLFENEECKRRISEPTLFMMLHCGKSMYNNLLWANWNCLCDVCIVGNRFSSYVERFPSRDLEETAPFISKISNYTREHCVENTFKYKDIFNDTSIHTFPASLLQLINQKTWNDVSEPVSNENDPEIVTKANIKQNNSLREITN